MPENQIAYIGSTARLDPILCRSLTFQYWNVRLRERAAKAERAAAAVAAAAAEAERAAEAAEALRLKILALAQPAAEGVSPCDAAGVDQAPTGYSSVGSSGAPPSLSPLSPAFPLGCASVFGSGLGAWLRFGWDPGGAGLMRGREQRSAAACA